VPGSADSLASHGCNRLIRDGARLVETIDVILEEPGTQVRKMRTAADETSLRHTDEPTLDDQGRSLLGQLNNDREGWTT
jgi:DNA processing protein